MLYIPPLPSYLHFALSAFRLEYPKAFIAGGALRDLVYGKPVKDLDIFVGPDFNPYFNSSTILLKALGPCGTPETAEYGNFWGPRLLGVFEADLKTFLDLPPVQIIMLRNMPSLPACLEDFDLGFTQIGYDGSMVYFTPLFAKDFFSNTITVTKRPTTECQARTERRLVRFAQKYPEKTVVRL